MRQWIVVGMALASAAAVSAQPSIDANGVVNASGYQNKLAPDTVFVIFGHGLGPASLAAGAAPNYLTLLSGTSITFTPVGGGAAIDAKIVYTVASQVAGLLPSAIAPGDYAVRATYNNQPSAAQNVTVVARSFGIATANGGGSGPAQATIGNINGGLSLVRFTGGMVNFGGYDWVLSASHPGDTLVLWGTGGGADAANDSGGSSGDQTAEGGFKVIVAGREITPLFAGASAGFPGLWQINFALPVDMALDCFTQIRVSANGELSNAATIAIAASGESACSDPDLSQATLAKLDAGGDIVVAAFGVAKLTATDVGVTNESASGVVAGYTAAQWALGAPLRPRLGQCGVYDRTYPVGGVDPANAGRTLDAGASLSLSGPNLPAGFGLGSINTATGPVYLNSPAAGTLASGVYTLTGLGGPEVGPFTASTNFPGSFTVTNWDSITAIDRTRPLAVNWSGSGFETVVIGITSASTAGGNQHIVNVTCVVSGALGTFSVPSAVLATLQAAAATGANFGNLTVTGQSTPGTFTASLASGGSTDIGVFGGSLSVSKNIAVQ